jgi:uncharacterized phage-associated protein
VDNAFFSFLLVRNFFTRVAYKLFKDEFETGVHGPVIYSIYDRFKYKGYQEIENFEGVVPKIDEDTTDILQQVWEEYGHLMVMNLHQLLIRKILGLKSVVMDIAR